MDSMRGFGKRKVFGLDWDAHDADTLQKEGRTLYLSARGCMMRIEIVLSMLVLMVILGCNGTSKAPSMAGDKPDARAEVVIIGQDLPGDEDQEETTHDWAEPLDVATGGEEGVENNEIEADKGAWEEVQNDMETDADAGETAFVCSFDGQPCDDSDPCTYNDQCKNGECIGMPVPCNDGVECTKDFCKDGQCLFEIEEDACLIEGRCYKRLDLNIANPCLYCLPETSKTAWSNADGFKCNDQDPCTFPDECRDGVCMPGPNICLPKTCSYHSDCTGQVCALWEIDGQKHCASTCVGSTGCAPNQICSKLDGASAVGFCQSALHPNGAAVGAPCTDKDTCQSNMCERGICAHFCADATVCSLGTCYVATGNPTDVYGACAPDSTYPGGLPLGETCTKDGGQTFDPSLCLSGHCDLSGGARKCMNLCRTDSQCPQGRICDIIRYADAPSDTASQLKEGDSLRFYESVLGCFTAVKGYKGLGDPCDTLNPGECTYRKCYFDGSKSYCTTFCGNDQDCPSFMRCDIAAWPLASDYLGQPFSQPKKPDSYTLVKICKPR